MIKSRGPSGTASVTFTLAAGVGASHAAIGAEIEHVAAADPASKWQTADNYNHSHPFNSIDDLTVAISRDDSRHDS